MFLIKETEPKDLYKINQFLCCSSVFFRFLDGFVEKLVFKRVVARRAVYHTLNVITISLYVRPCV